MPIKLTIDKKFLNKLYITNNLSIYQIAPILKCHPATVAKKLHEYQIPIKPPAKQIRISISDLKELYLKRRLSTYKIAEHFRCTVKTVTQRMEQYGIARRPLKNIIIDRKILEKFYTKDAFSLKNIGEIYNLTPSAVLRKMRKFNIPLRKSWENNIIHPKKPFSGSLEEKAYLIGFRLGDLGVKLKSKHTGSIVVKSNTTKPEQITLMKGLFSHYSHVWISGPNARGVFHFTTLVNSSFAFLITKDDCVPNWIKNNINLSSAFIAGYTDAEGSIGIYNGMARFRIGSYDIGILKHIHKTFINLGIKSILRLEQLKGFIDKRGVIHNGDFWRITVNEKRSLLLLFDLLHPYLKHAKRLKDLSQARNNIIQRNNAIIQA